MAFHAVRVLTQGHLRGKRDPINTFAFIGLKSKYNSYELLFDSDCVTNKEEEEDEARIQGTSICMHTKTLLNFTKALAYIVVGL